MTATSQVCAAGCCSSIFWRLVLLILALASPVLAQNVAPGQPRVEERRTDRQGLRLQEVLDIAMTAATGPRLAALQVESSRGDVLTAGAIYDGLLRVSSAQSRRDDPVLGSLALDTTEVAVAWSKRLRSGLTIMPAAFVTRSAVEGSSNVAPNSGGVDVTLSLPLLEDRGGALGRLTEQAAKDANQAALSDLAHERTDALLQTASAYWRYVAAHRRLEVFSLSDERASILVEETGALVAADERPRADLNQVEANRAIKRIDQVTAEQRLHDARRALGVAMGLPAAEVLGIPAAADGFPPTAPFELGPSVSDQLVSLARRNRADLAASAWLELSAQRAVEAAENTLKAKLELSFGAGYRGIDGGNDVGSFLGALVNEVPGLSASVGLRYELPNKNAAARGRTERSRALLEQQRVLHEDLDRRITSAVRVAALALASSLKQASYIESAVAASQATVENEKEKYGLGLATLFDIIQAEDNLRAALLSEIDIRLAHALALAGLRFETGTMIVSDDPPAARAEWFAIPPQL